MDVNVTLKPDVKEIEHFARQSLIVVKLSNYSNKYKNLMYNGQKIYCIEGTQRTRRYGLRMMFSLIVSQH